MSAVIVIGHFRLPVESLDAARQPMARVVAATRGEPGPSDRQIAAYTASGSKTL